MSYILRCDLPPNDPKLSRRRLAAGIATAAATAVGSSAVLGANNLMSVDNQRNQIRPSHVNAKSDNNKPSQKLLLSQASEIFFCAGASANARSNLWQSAVNLSESNNDTE
jgi:hypothetical protein